MNIHQWLGLLAVVVLLLVLLAYRIFNYKAPLPLSQDEQQRRGDAEYNAWLQAMGGQSMIFGEMRAAAQRIQNKYPAWRSSPGAGPMTGPDRAEYL